MALSKQDVCHCFCAVRGSRQTYGPFKTRCLSPCFCAVRGGRLMALSKQDVCHCFCAVRGGRLKLKAFNNNILNTGNVC